MNPATGIAILILTIAGILANLAFDAAVMP